MDRQLNQQKWQEIITSQMASGLKQVEWCEKNDVNIHNFRYWKNRLSANKPTDIDEKPTWTIITPASRDKTDKINSQITVTIGNASVTIDSSFNEDVLEKLVSVLMKHV